MLHIAYGLKLVIERRNDAFSDLSLRTRLVGENARFANFLQCFDKRKSARPNAWVWLRFDDLLRHADRHRNWCDARLWRYRWLIVRHPCVLLISASQFGRR